MTNWARVVTTREDKYWQLALTGTYQGLVGLTCSWVMVITTGGDTGVYLGQLITGACCWSRSSRVYWLLVATED